MNGCCTRDELIDIAAATPGSTLNLVDHLARCEACRHELAVVDTVRDTVAEAPVPPGFTAAVMQRLDGERATAVEDAGHRGGVSGTVSGTLGGTTSWRRRARAAAVAALQAALLAGAMLTVLAAAALDSTLAMNGSLSAEHLLVGFLFALALTLGSAARAGTGEAPAG